MNLSSPAIIKQLLSKYGTRPSKAMGQNFLINKTALEKIIKAADLGAEDIVLEIGPGIGTLTQELAKNVKKVIAVEKDKYMCQILKETLKDYKNIEIINDDILKLNPEPYALNPYKVVANIPYYLTSPLIRKFLEKKYPPEIIVLMIQKEVAQRICAVPPNMSILAVSVQFYASPKIISYVKKENFWPKPKVDSAIIKIIPGGQTSREAGGLTSPGLFFRIVKAGFSQPRKQLDNNLSKMLKLNKIKTNSWLLKNKIKPTQRAETLSVDDWINLTKSF
ncbi:MAG: 16S rRNA (adenine(1518)-N(6)/adenine(1519)-N(6))-dimethyltransferase RsmA [Patescibacteria group bacterium]